MGIMKLFILLLAMVLAVQEPVSTDTEAIRRAVSLSNYNYRRYYITNYTYRYRSNRRYLAQKPTAGAELSTPDQPFYRYRYYRYYRYRTYYRYYRYYRYRTYYRY